ncbi:MAG: transcription termination factor NusA [Chloroflexi bacterium]|nr:transcription termination factor NusA [Chloroflexota bacterium]
MKSDFLIAVTQLAAERNLPRGIVVSAVEAALVSAYKKETSNQNHEIAVKLDPGSGDVAIFQLKTIVEEVTDIDREMTLTEAKKIRPAEAHAVGDILEFELPAHVAGRIPAQTAKQVVIQRLREAERELVFQEFSEREGEVYTGTVQRGDSRHSGVATLDLNGRAEAILPASEQSPWERYRPGQRLKVLILEVRRTNRGPEIVCSRTHPDLLRRLFEMEVPEIFNGIVELKAVAREAGARSKVAVAAKQEGVDPVGACVGLRGIRIQNIVSELQGEKIDVIQWSKSPSQFISNALSPAQPLRVEINEEEATAMVVVPDRHLSLAIGKEGQNARLAAKLTNWKIDIKSSSEVEIERMKQSIEDEVAVRAAAVDAPVVAEAEAVAAEAPVAEPEELVAAEEQLAEEPQEVTAEVPQDAEDEEALAAVPINDHGLSAEELLALESLDLMDTLEPVASLEETGIIEEEEEEVLIDEDEDDVWKLPESTEGPQIRFAEDILGTFGQRTGAAGGTSKRRRSRPARGANRGGASPPARSGGPGGAGGGRPAGAGGGRPGGSGGGRPTGTGGGRPSPRTDTTPAPDDDE